MEGLTPFQCIERGGQALDAEDYEEAMRFFGQGLILVHPNENQGLLIGFQVAASAFRQEVIINERERRSPVYHGVERPVNDNARGFYLPGMSAFINQDYKLAKLFFAEALTWDATNKHLLECFRTSVELGYRAAGRLRRRL